MLKDEKKSERKARKQKELDVSDLITADIETREMKEEAWYGRNIYNISNQKVKELIERAEIERPSKVYNMAPRKDIFQHGGAYFVANVEPVHGAPAQTRSPSPAAEDS